MPRRVLDLAHTMSVSVLVFDTHCVCVCICVYVSVTDVPCVLGSVSVCASMPVELPGCYRNIINLWCLHQQPLSLKPKKPHSAAALLAHADKVAIYLHTLLTHASCCTTVVTGFHVQVKQ